MNSEEITEKLAYQARKKPAFCVSKGGMQGIPWRDGPPSLVHTSAQAFRF